MSVLAISGQFRPSSYKDFLEYSANLAALVKARHQVCQEALARLYGFSGTHELQMALASKGTFGPFDGEEQGQAAEFRPLIEQRQARLDAWIIEMDQALPNRPIWKLRSVLESFGLFSRPKRHRARAKEILRLFKWLEPKGFAPGEIAALLLRYIPPELVRYAATPAVSQRVAGKLSASQLPLPFDVEGQLRELMQYQLPLICARQLRQPGARVGPDNWGYEDKYPLLEAYFDDRDANELWIDYIEAAHRQVAPDDTIGMEFLSSRAGQKGLVEFLKNPSKQVAEGHLVLSLIPRITTLALSWEDRRQRAWLAAYRDQCEPITMLSPARETLLTGEERREFRLECKVLLRTDYGVADEEGMYAHSFTVNYSLAHAPTGHRTTLALGHGHLLVPFKGRAIPSREDFLDALEYTAFGSITKDIQAYFVQRNLGDNGGFVTAHPGGALAMIDILMAEGYSHDDWMPDLLNVFRNAFLDYPFSAVGAKPEPRQLESEFEGKVQFAPPVVFFVAEAGTLTTKSDGAARKEKRDVGDRPFVAALKALPHGSTDFDGAVVTAE